MPLLLRLLGRALWMVSGTRPVGVPGCTVPGWGTGLASTCFSRPVYRVICFSYSSSRSRACASVETGGRHTAREGHGTQTHTTPVGAGPDGTERGSGGAGLDSHLAGLGRTIFSC